MIFFCVTFPPGSSALTKAVSTAKEGAKVDAAVGVAAVGVAPNSGGVTGTAVVRAPGGKGWTCGGIPKAEVAEVGLATGVAEVGAIARTAAPIGVAARDAVGDAVVAAPVIKACIAFLL